MKNQDLQKKISLLQTILELTKRLRTLSAYKPGLQPLVERKANAIIEAMALLGHPVRITEGYRSIERQNALYAQGRTTPGQIVTNAKGGQSFHNYGVAVDFVFKKEGYNASEELWQTLGAVGRSQGFDWGGDWVGFKDRPHMELKLGYTLKDFQDGKIDWSRYA
jgi:peptidoglycan L-alanyl-D-glutamate endopeptidase CwlK